MADVGRASLPPQSLDPCSNWAKESGAQQVGLPAKRLLPEAAPAWRKDALVLEKCIPGTLKLATFTGGQQQPTKGV